MGEMEVEALRTSHASAGARFVFLVIAAAAFAVLVLVLEGNRNNPRGQGDAAVPARRRRHRDGSGRDSAWNLLHYDPRLQGVDDSNLWPVPGSYPYNPSAVSAAVSFREAPREDLRITKVGK